MTNRTAFTIGTTLIVGVSMAAAVVAASPASAKGPSGQGQTKRVTLNPDDAARTTWNVGNRVRTTRAPGGRPTTCVLVNDAGGAHNRPALGHARWHSGLNGTGRVLGSVKFATGKNETGGACHTVPGKGTSIVLVFENKNGDAAGNHHRKTVVVNAANPR